MGRATTKTDLINAASINFNKLYTIFNTMSDKERLTPVNFSDNNKNKKAHWHRDKNIKDFLIHLYEWHQLLINWMTSNTKGDTASFFPEPYN